MQHFFGGAMGVFTTQTLLNSVGISRNSATPGAVAINWILKVGRHKMFGVNNIRPLSLAAEKYQLTFASQLLLYNCLSSSGCLVCKFCEYSDSNSYFRIYRATESTLQS